MSISRVALLRSRQVPMQDNCCDCGVFVIQYVWMFCRLWMMHEDLDHFRQHLFTMKDIKRQRRKIGKRINLVKDKAREGTEPAPIFNKEITLHSGGGCYHAQVAPAQDDDTSAPAAAASASAVRPPADV